MFQKKLLIFATLVASLVLTASVCAQNVRAFATPEEAIQALVAALRAPTTQPLEELFGRAILENVPPEERRSDADRRAAGERLAEQTVKIVYDNGDRTRARAIVGEENFRLPTPLVRSDQGWIFDGAAGVAEMTERRIDVNEGNAIRALQALARAQDFYRQADRDGSGVLHYAARIRGTDGKLDGLVNPDDASVPGPATSLLNQAFGRAEGKPGDPDHHPAGGYGYAILTAQGPHAEGGARDLLVNGNLVDGYAVIAWPTRPGVTGNSTFIMSQEGVVYEQEFGDETLEAVRKLTAFDPDDNWSPVEE